MSQSTILSVPRRKTRQHKSKLTILDLFPQIPRTEKKNQIPTTLKLTKRLAMILFPVTSKMHTKKRL